ncbi:hypothetical protein C8R48DRAFT_679849 [Suillus tomentosus]|nr:hypothetical protein C8R48DRAFT_679849 [Suillus tomentosus]
MQLCRSILALRLLRSLSSCTAESFFMWLFAWAVVKSFKHWQIYLGGHWIHMLGPAPDSMYQFLRSTSATAILLNVQLPIWVHFKICRLPTPKFEIQKPSHLNSSLIRPAAKWVCLEKLLSTSFIQKIAFKSYNAHELRLRVLEVHPTTTVDFEVSNSEEVFMILAE